MGERNRRRKYIWAYGIGVYDINKLLHESLDLLKGYQKFVKENWIETTVG